MWRFYSTPNYLFKEFGSSAEQQAACSGSVRCGSAVWPERGSLVPRCSAEPSLRESGPLSANMSESWKYIFSERWVHDGKSACCSCFHSKSWPVDHKKKQKGCKYGLTYLKTWLIIWEQILLLQILLLCLPRHTEPFSVCTDKSINPPIRWHASLKPAPDLDLMYVNTFKVAKFARSFSACSSVAEEMQSV